MLAVPGPDRDLLATVMIFTVDGRAVGLQRRPDREGGTLKPGEQGPARIHGRGDGPSPGP